MLFEVCEAYQKSVWYTNVNSTSVPSCPTPTPVTIEGCGCGCAYAAGTKPSWFCDLDGGTYEWAVLPFDFSAKRSSTASQVVLLDYQDQVNQTVSGNWQFDDGSGPIATNFTFSATHVRLRYANLAVPFPLSPVPTSGSGILTCCDYTSASTQAIYAWFWERARYTNDISAFGVYGANATYAAWTIEITTGAAIIRDGGGIIQYQWALANYDMDGLRLAIDGTAELVGRRIAMSTGTNLRTRAATAIPPQGPKPVGQSIATEAKIVLRTAGDEVEGYQIIGMAGYAANTANTVPNYFGARRTETFFGGTLADFRRGFALAENEFLGSPPTYPNSPNNTGLSASPPCPTGAGSCGISAVISPLFGGDNAFGNNTAVLSGTAWEGIFSDETANAYSLGAGNGSNCMRYACVNETQYWWYKARVMYEVERI